MKNIAMVIFTLSNLFLSIVIARAQVVWGLRNSRTETRDDAGLQGNNGARSGFFEAQNPVNYPNGASSWWHLLDVRHSSPDNNYALQIAGSFFDQNLYFRKTNDNPSMPWSRVLSETNGKVGIGTTSPVAPLDVNGYFILRALSGGAALNVSNLADQDLQIHITAPGASDKYSFIGPSTHTSLALGSGGVEKVRITNAGDFGIGTTTPQAKLDVNGNIFTNGKIAIGTTDASKMAGYALAVNGDAIFNKVKVKLYNNWPDYVFEPGYKLVPLSVIETYIKNHKHLPEVPSADEIEKNGLDVGENQTILLKKVEELTLYLIEQNKQQTLTKEIILCLNKQIEAMQMTVESQATILKEQQQLLLQFKKQ